MLRRMAGFIKAIDDLESSHTLFHYEDILREFCRILPQELEPGTPISQVVKADTMVEVEVTPNRPDRRSESPRCCSAQT